MEDLRDFVALLFWEGIFFLFAIMQPCLKKSSLMRVPITSSFISLHVLYQPGRTCLETAMLPARKATPPQGILVRAGLSTLVCALCGAHLDCCYYFKTLFPLRIIKLSERDHTETVSAGFTTSLSFFFSFTVCWWLVFLCLLPFYFSASVVTVTQGRQHRGVCEYA